MTCANFLSTIMTTVKIYHAMGLYRSIGIITYSSYRFKGQAHGRERVEAFFETLIEPKTISEIAEELGSDVSVGCLEKIVQLLVEDGVVQCKVIDLFISDQRCRLYWKSSINESMQTPHRPPTTSGLRSAFRSPLSSGNPSTKARQPFKSPALARKTTPSTSYIPPSIPSKETPASVRSRILELKTELDSLEREIAELRGSYSVEELQTHIDTLHQYNELKDIGQILLGKLAEVEGTTTASLYARYGLELDN